MDTTLEEHAAWFWQQVAGGGQGVSVPQLTEHVTPDAFCPQVSFSSPGSFSTSLRTGLFAGATLGEVRLDERRRVVTSFITGRGLQLEATFIGATADAGHISAVGLRTEGGASVTAASMARFRAAHWILDEPKILADTLAEPLAGEFAAACIASVRTDPMAFPSRYSVAARSRLADEILGDGQTGADQYVVLGAGPDSFAYRRSDTGEGLRVFEVDHPASQSWETPAAGRHWGDHLGLSLLRAHGLRAPTSRR